MKVKVVNLSNNPLPKYAHEPIDGLVQDSGMDVYADFTKLNDKFVWDCDILMDENKNITSITINPLGRILIPTGLHFEVPLGYEIQIRDRSGYALKKGITLTNGVATLDSCYRGDCGVILSNISNRPVVIEAGERIAQIVLAKVETCEWEIVDSLDDLSETSRGEGGYNSTGIK